MMSSSILELENLTVGYYRQNICENISLQLKPGEILGIAGASGSGKSTLLKSIIDPEAYGVDIRSGQVIYRGEDITHLSESSRNHLLGKEIGMIFQNPMASFNPLRKYEKQFREALKSHGLWHGQSREEILDLFETLGLPRADGILGSYPFEMSGGMNQRIAIALGVLLHPRLLLADEPTSALDATSQQQVIAVFRKIQTNYKLSMILVSHDLCSLAQLCDRIIVMEEGVIVEENTVENIILNPQHDYTRRLFSATPTIGEVNHD